MNKGIDRFGEMVVSRMYDRSLKYVRLLRKGHWKSPGVKGLQKHYVEMAEEDAELVLSVVRLALEEGMHDFLLALHESVEQGEIDFRVEGRSISEISDGLQAEPFGDDGWLSRFSKEKSR